MSGCGLVEITRVAFAMSLTAAVAMSGIARYPVVCGRRRCVGVAVSGRVIASTHPGWSGCLRLPGVWWQWCKCEVEGHPEAPRGGGEWVGKRPFSHGKKLGVALWRFYPRQKKLRVWTGELR